MPDQTFDTPGGPYEFILPANATELIIQCFGGGQGGYAGPSVAGGNGGLSGSFATTNLGAKPAGYTLNIYVASGGIAGIGFDNPGDGGDSMAEEAGSTIVCAAPGGNSTGSAVGDGTLPSTQGGMGNSFFPAGGGGGGCPSSTSSGNNGENAVGSSPGNGGAAGGFVAPLGGDGGNGASSGVPGADGNQPGGGGGGGANSGGGAGGAGLVYISWTEDTGGGGATRRHDRRRLRAG